MNLSLTLFLFRWDPVERLTPEEGLRHPWVVETKLKRSSRESRTRYKTKKDDNNTSGVNGDSCKIYFSFYSITFFRFVLNRF
jgi:hypothetical protein